MSEDSKEEIDTLFWKRRWIIGTVTALVVLVSSLIFYFSSMWTNFLLETLEETTILVPSLLISSYLKYALDLKYRKVKTGYSGYARNSISYLYIVIPFWVMSAAIILSFGRTYLTFLYLDLMLGVIITGLVVNIRVQIWKRSSKEISNSRIIEGAKRIAEKMGVEITGFREVNWSRAKIANAFQAGLRHRYVFVTNFMIDNLTEDEDLAIIAHEMAHAKMNHLTKTMVFVGIDLLLIGNALFAFIVFTLNYGAKLGLAFGIAASVFVTAYILLPILQRRFEMEADLIAATFTNPRLLADSLLKISRLNHTPINIHWHWNPSHPSTSERIAYLKELENKEKDINDGIGGCTTRT